MSDLVPAEAIEAAALAQRSSSHKPGPPDPDLVAIWTRTARITLEAAAPLILAADLERQAATFDMQADALEAPRMGTPASGMVTVLRDLAMDARGRASVLRGEGDRDG